MSKRSITKEVEAVICDFCDKEVDTKSDDYCYHHLRSYNGEVMNSHEHRVKRILFSWYRPKKVTPNEYIQYDFHASCFDDLMTKFLEEKRNKEQ